MFKSNLFGNIPAISENKLAHLNPILINREA
jgi:hypothetical protein